MENSTTTETNSTLPPDIPSDLKFLLTPLIVIVVVILLSALVYLMAKKRRLDTMRENILALYELDANEEWDSFNSFDHCSYNTMDYTTAV